MRFAYIASLVLFSTLFFLARAQDEPSPDLNAFLATDSLAIPAGLEGAIDIVALATGKDKAATDELVAMLLKVKTVADKEPGCRLYHISRSSTDDTVTILEGYISKAAVDHHLAGAEVKLLNSKLASLTSGTFLKWSKEVK